MGRKSKIWRLIPHHVPSLRNECIKWYLNNKKVAIGWGGIGDMRVEGYSTPKAIGYAIETKCKLSNRRIGGPSLWRFYNDVQDGDYIILSGTEGKRPVVQVKVVAPATEGYSFEPEGFPLDADYKHQLSIVPTNLDYKDLINSSSWKPVSGQSIRSPFIECQVQ